MKNKITFNQDSKAFSLYIMKVFPSEASKVWDYFTKSELLDQWWAPKPWKNETLEMNFEPDGKWRFAMKSPDGIRHYSAVEFHEINPTRSFDWSSYFTDENGVKIPDFEPENWLFGFTGVEEGTKLTINIHFKSKESMVKLLETGFENGLKMGLTQLEDLITTREKFGSHSF